MLMDTRLRQNRERFSERIGNVAEKVEHCDVNISHGVGSSVGAYLVADAVSKPKEESALSKATHGRRVFQHLLSSLYSCQVLCAAFQHLGMEYQRYP